MVHLLQQPGRAVRRGAHPAGRRRLFRVLLHRTGAKSKAHPEVFHEVLERLGGSEPADAVVCEDAVYATRTARQCGFYLINIEDETSAADKPELQRLADQYITDWTHLDWTKL